VWRRCGRCANLEKRGHCEVDAKVGRAQENKVTLALAADRELGLHPLLFVIDECQTLSRCNGSGKPGRRAGRPTATGVLRPGPCTTRW
jgi:S-DNA-T family DNA segregation ATPase FtsK/SpoIIIE